MAAALHAVVRTPDIDATRELLRRADIDVNRVDQHGNTPLMAALYARQSGQAAVLVADARVDVNAAGANDGPPPLWFVCWTGNVQVLTALLACDRVRYDAAVDSRGSTVLHVAQHSTLNALFADPRTAALMYAVDEYGYTPLARAMIHHEGEDRALAMLERAADIECPTRGGNRTLLHLACYRGWSQMTARLLTAGADDEARDWQVSTHALQLILTLRHRDVPPGTTLTVRRATCCSFTATRDAYWCWRRAGVGGAAPAASRAHCGIILYENSWFRNNTHISYSSMLRAALLRARLRACAHALVRADNDVRIDACEARNAAFFALDDTDAPACPPAYRMVQRHLLIEIVGCPPDRWEVEVAGEEDDDDVQQAAHQLLDRTMATLVSRQRRRGLLRLVRSYTDHKHNEDIEIYKMAPVRVLLYRPLSG